jgi:hypothetical protein
MENIEQTLPVTKEDNKKLLKRYKPVIIAFIVFFAVVLIICVYSIILFNQTKITILISSFYLLTVSMFSIIIYGGFLSPLLRDKVIGKKRQVIGIITEKLEKDASHEAGSSRLSHNMLFYIVLGGKEEIKIPYNEYIKLEVNKKIKIEYLVNSKSIISIEDLSENDTRFNYSENDTRFNYSDINSTKNIDNLSEKEIKYLKKKRNKKIIGFAWFFGLLGYIFYFILKVIIVAVVFKIFPGANEFIETSVVRNVFFDASPAVLLGFIALWVLYLRINKIIKDIRSKKKRIVKAKIDDKIRSEEIFHKTRRPEIKKMINTVRVYSFIDILFDIKFWERFAKSFLNGKKSTALSKTLYYYYLVINKVYYKVTHENFDKFEIDEKVNIHSGYYSDLPVLIQSIDDKDETIDISIIYEKKK